MFNNLFNALSIISMLTYCYLYIIIYIYIFLSRRNEACIFDNTMVDESQGLQVEKSCRDGTHLRNNCGKYFHSLCTK